MLSFTCEWWVSVRKFELLSKGHLKEFCDLHVACCTAVSAVCAHC